ncbi:MAG: hypothetical protein AB1761_13960 [Pseudomonadota bacterium]
MFKFAIATGISVEWLLGPTVESWLGFGLASLRTLMASAAAWMIFEAGRAVFSAVMTLEDKP